MMAKTSFRWVCAALRGQLTARRAIVVTQRVHHVLAHMNNELTKAKHVQLLERSNKTGPA